MTLSANFGTLKLGDVAAGTLAAGAGGTLNVGAAGAFDLNGFAATAANLTGSGLITNNGGAAATLSVGAGNFSGNLVNGTTALGLTKIGAGSLTLSSNNTFTGGLTVGWRLAGGGQRGRVGCGRDRALRRGHRSAWARA